MALNGGLAKAFGKRWALPLALFAFCLAIYAPTISGHRVNTDAAANSLTAWRIAHTGKPWMEGLDLQEPGKVVHYRPGANGHTVSNGMAAIGLFGAPFYVGTPDDQESFDFTRGGLAAATLAAGAVTLVFLALRRRAGESLALLAAGVFGFTTPQWTVAADALWAHPLTVFGLAGAAWAVSRDRWITAGLFLGFAIMARPHIALAAAVIGIWLAGSRRRPRIAASVGIPCFAALGLLSLWAHFVYGSWDFRGPYAGYEYSAMVTGENFQGWGLVVNYAGFLVSPDRGFFVWTPLALLLLPSVVRTWKQAPDWCRALAGGGMLYTAAQTTMSRFDGGDGFYGYRLGLELLVCLTPLYALSLKRVGRGARTAFPVLVAVQFAFASVGAFLQGFSALRDDQWEQNSFLLAFQDEPQLVGAVTAAALIVGCLVMLRQRRSEHQQPATLEQPASAR